MIILNTLTLQKQFSAFCAKNQPKDMEEAINYFTVFGGLDIKIDTSVPLLELIQKHILKEYKYLRNDISRLSGGENLAHLILSGIAMGDRRTNSAFKRAKISFDEGIKVVDELCNLGVLKLETPFGQKDVPEKALFTSPFVRFWFAFISPLFKGIKEGDYAEFTTRFKNREEEFSNLIFEQLSHELLKEIFEEDKIYNIGRYWDTKLEIDVVAKTKSGTIIAGVCKYTNAKVKKSELTKLQENCKEAGIKPDIFVFFTKKGYTNELKALKCDTLKLLTCRNFKLLLEGNSPKDAAL